VKDRAGARLLDAGERAVFNRRCLAPRKEALGITRRIPEKFSALIRLNQLNPWFL
jgi:hypothetical protein